MQENDYGTPRKAVEKTLSDPYFVKLGISQVYTNKKKTTKDLHQKH